MRPVLIHLQLAVYSVVLALVGTGGLEIWWKAVLINYYGIGHGIVDDYCRYEVLVD